MLLRLKRMKILKSVIPVVVLSSLNAPAIGVPIVPNFQSGSLTSRTETSSTVTETINVVEYQTGWQYTVTGNNISTDSDSLVPPTSSTTQSINGVNSTWTTLDATSMPNFSITDSSQPWQLTTTLSQPGLKSQTIIQRTTEVTSVTDTVSTFSQ